MYSPKISEYLIPRIYRAAKEAKMPMTRWVNAAVERALPASNGIVQTVELTADNLSVADVASFASGSQGQSGQVNNLTLV